MQTTVWGRSAFRGPWHALADTKAADPRPTRCDKKLRGNLETVKGDTPPSDGRACGACVRSVGAHIDRG